MINGQLVKLDLTCAYPVTNAMALSMETLFVPYLQQAGIRLTLVPMDMKELLRSYNDRDIEEIDMFYLGADFNIEFGGPWLTMYGVISGPEQAIEATLGRGTCHVVSSIRHDYEGGYAGTEWEHELSCGHKVWWGNDDPPEWCPWCGAKVVCA